jgi:hypothetical protein
MAAGRPGRCVVHTWERRQEAVRGVECVVRICHRCGVRELCWSRRPLPEAAVAGIGPRVGGRFADE